MKHFIILLMLAIPVLAPAQTEVLFNANTLDFDTKVVEGDYTFGIYSDNESTVLHYSERDYTREDGEFKVDTGLIVTDIKRTKSEVTYHTDYGTYTFFKKDNHIVKCLYNLGKISFWYYNRELQ
jgi:hypothetical protein